MKIILFLPYVSRALWFPDLFLSPFPVLLCLLFSICIFPQQHPFPVGFIATPTPTPSVAEISDEVHLQLHSQGISPTATAREKANAPLPGGAERRGHPTAQQQPRAGKAAASQLLEPLPFLAELQHRAGTPWVRVCPGRLGNAAAGWVQLQAAGWTPPAQQPRSRLSQWPGVVGLVSVIISRSGM